MIPPARFPPHSRRHDGTLTPAAKAAAAERLLELAFVFQGVLCSQSDRNGAPSGQSTRESFTHEEAKALDGELHSLSPSAKAAAVERLLELAFDFQSVLLAYVYREPDGASRGRPPKERFTREEAEAVAHEIQSLSHFFEWSYQHRQAGAAEIGPLPT
jgi:hypothetical protein